MERQGKDHTHETMSGAILRLLQYVGPGLFKFCCPAYRTVPMTREKNRELRLKQAQEWIEADEKFDDVFFTDESTVALERFALHCYRKKGHAGIRKPCVKHPLKLHVWGGISRQGAGPLLIFDGELSTEMCKAEKRIK